MSKRCPVLSIANTKGGVGKSTLATNLAAEAASSGLQALLVDTDPQASSTVFAATRPEDRSEFRVIQMTKAILHRELPQLSEPYDLVIVDTWGQNNATFRSAVAAASLVLVPVTPSAYDVWASEDVFNVIDELAATRVDLEIRVVMNLVIPRTRIAREALDALSELTEGLNTRLLDTRLHARVAWKMSSGEGLSVTEWEPKGAAADELRSLWRELRTLLGLA